MLLFDFLNDDFIAWIIEQQHKNNKKNTKTHHSSSTNRLNKKAKATEHTTFIYVIIHLLEIETDIHTVPTSYIYIYKLSSIRNNHKIGNMASIVKETKQKRTRKRPGRKERRRKRQEEAKNNNGSAISNINKNITDLNINKSNVIIVQSPMKIWLLKHSGEDDEVPDEICDYIKSMASDTSVDIEDVINVIQQFIPAFSTKLTSAEQHEEVQILLNIIQNKKNKK